MQTRTTFPDHPFTWAHLAAAGGRRKHLDLAVADGAVLRLFRGVYLRSDVELTPLVRARAAALVISDHSVVCDRTAAWLLGVDLRRLDELEGTPAFDSCVLRGHDPTDRPDCAGRTRDLIPEDWTMVSGGVRVTTPVRTALDLGCLLRRREALAAMDALARAYGFGPDELRRVLPRYFRRRGVIQVRQLVPLVDGRSESAAESWTRLEIADHGLPMPELQHWVEVDGVAYRLDMAYPEARVAVEYDGAEFHSSPEARERDELRRARLAAYGWKVIVVTRETFSDGAWIRELRVSLAARVS